MIVSKILTLSTRLDWKKEIEFRVIKYSVFLVDLNK